MRQERSLVEEEARIKSSAPVPMIALVAFTRRRDIMGGFVNSPDAGCGRDRHGRDPIALNGVLVLQTFGAPIAGLPAS